MFWFGSGYIYARINLNQYIYMAGQKKMDARWYFSFLSPDMNTEFEHKSVNTGGYHWRLQ